MFLIKRKLDGKFIGRIKRYRYKLPSTGWSTDPTNHLPYRTEQQAKGDGFNGHRAGKPPDIPNDEWDKMLWGPEKHNLVRQNWDRNYELIDVTMTFVVR